MGINRDKGDDGDIWLFLNADRADKANRGGYKQWLSGLPYPAFSAQSANSAFK